VTRNNSTASGGQAWANKFIASWFKGKLYFLQDRHVSYRSRAVIHIECSLKIDLSYEKNRIPLN
jgi:hypothetical protein